MSRKVINVIVNNNVNFVDIGNYTVTTQEETVPVHILDLNEEDINKFISNDNVKFTGTIDVYDVDIPFQFDCTKILNIDNMIQFSVVATATLLKDGIVTFPGILLLYNQSVPILFLIVEFS